MNQTPWTYRSKILKAKKILYLASYPKSGNTWFRSFLSALILGEVEINKLASSGILSGRAIIDKTHDIDSSLLYSEEVKSLYAPTYKYKASISEGLQTIKAHDAYQHDAKGEPIIDIESTHKCVYLVRNPLDVVASFANHNNSTIEDSIRQLCDKTGILGTRDHGLNNKVQIPQLMYDWSGHVGSWLDQDDLEVILVRYEDMKKNGVDEFIRVVRAIGFECSDEDITKAVELTQFEKLKAQENEEGFKENLKNATSFFRSGKTGGWKHELTIDQVRQMVETHQEMMDRLGYLEPAIEHLNKNN